MKLSLSHSLLISSLVLGTFFTSASALAVCDDMTTECAAAGAATGAGAASGIYGMKKYKDASTFEASNSKSIAEFSSTPKAISNSQIDSFGQEMQEGDKVTVHYQLNEVQNRQHHISVMESKAASARTTAMNYRSAAIAAATPRLENRMVADGKGGVVSELVTIPGDAVQAMNYTALAASSDAEASNFLRKADDARRGGPVPLYTLDREFTESSGTRTAVSNFLKERMAADGKIVRIKLLPALQFAQAKKMIWAARGGVAGAAIGAGVAAEQMISGAMKNKYDDSSRSDSYTTMRPYNTVR